MNLNQHLPGNIKGLTTAGAVLPTLMLMVCMFFCKQADGQRVRYEDLMAELDQITNEQAYSRLFRYQSSNPYFANTYIQTGHLCENIIKELDPLRQIEQVKYWANNAIIYYQLFPVYLQNNEVRRTRELYLNLPIESSGRRLNNEDVLEYIDNRVAITKNYRDSVMLIYETLERSKDHYNLCIRLFFEVNEQYDQLKEVLLQADQPFLQRIDMLQQAFEACTIAFAQYKHLTSLFPIKDYDQSYSLKTIETFRLDGLTNSDFLAESFTLWDFGHWVARFRQTYNENILALRNDIEKIQQSFDNNLLFLRSVDHIGHTLPASSFDELFIYRLGVYDSHSLVRELFNYLSERQIFLLMTKDSLNNPEYISTAYLNRKFRYYYRMALQLKHAEEKLHVFTEAISPQRVRRFKDFFHFYYNGEAGLHTFSERQHSLLYEGFSGGLQNLKITLQQERSAKNSWTVARGDRGLQISLTPEYKPFSTDTDMPITRSVFFEHDMPAFAGGTLTRQQSRRAFIAKVADDQTVEWHQEINDGQYTAQLFGYESGVTAIVTTPILSSDEDDPLVETGYKNNLVHLTRSGRMVFNTELEESNYPLYMHYDDINQLYRMVFGQQTDQQGIYDSFVFCLADSVGSLLWSTNIDARGSFAGVFRAEDRYLFFTNFFVGSSQPVLTTQRQPAEKWNCMLTHISPDGHIMDTSIYPSAKSYYIDKTFGISSDEFNLTGYEGVPGQTAGRLIYMIISANGGQIFHNLDE